MTADGSMAVWSEHKAGHAGASAEVHFNYWRIVGDSSFVRSTKGTAKDFVEIGILLKDASQVEKVSIYLPGDVWKIEDCGPYFAEPDIAQGIFNEQLSCTSGGPPGPRRVDLVRPDHSQLCRVHIFPKNGETIDPNELGNSPLADGVLLTITRHALDEACHGLPGGTDVYFRLRAYCNAASETSPFVKRIKPKDRFLQTGYSVVDYMDFRLNEARSLPTQVESLMRSGGTRVPHKLVAFLTAVPVQSDVTTISWEKSHKKRLLEDDLWTAYVPTGIPPGMTVYHWRETATAAKPSIEDFSGFVKMQTRLVSWPVLVTSVLIAFVFGVLGNLVASWIWDHGSASATPADTHASAAPGSPPGQQRGSAYPTPKPAAPVILPPETPSLDKRQQ